MYRDNDSKGAMIDGGARQVFESVSPASIQLPHFFARVHPVMKLVNGTISGHIAEFSREFDELPAGVMTRGKEALPNVCDWMITAIKKTFIARTKQSEQYRQFDTVPMLIPAPDALFQLADSTSQCETILARLSVVLSELNPGHVTCFVFRDGTFSASEEVRANSLQAFRNHGFRLAIDWRDSWATQLDPAMARMFDTAIVPDVQTVSDVDLLVRIYEAKLAEIPVIIQGARWRDISELAEIGVNYVTMPACDG